MTVVGDIAQTSAAWGAPSWRAVLEPVAPGRWREEELTVNYRTPSEVMAVAADVLTAIDPHLEPPTSVRDSGRAPVAVRAEALSLTATVAAAAVEACAAAEGGTVGVLTPPQLHAEVLDAVRAALPEATAGEPLEAQVSVLTVTAAKGLEFDRVVLVEPALVAETGVNGLRDLYVALTRPTQHLAVVHARDLPGVLHRL
jgi:DNA helicase IV